MTLPIRPVFVGFLVLSALLTGGCSGIMGRYEEPTYTVVESRGEIEVRQYPERLVAQVEMGGEREEAINNGFRAIADYIFGNNSPGEKIAMTAPVTQQKAGQKIPMTAPVTQQAQGDAWQVRFFMPSRYSLDTLPKPNNPQVQLQTVPAQKVVVIRFSGRWTEANLKKHLDELQARVKDRGLVTVGEPVMAFYNPPWTLPFLRRNEIMLALADVDSRVAP